MPQASQSWPIRDRKNEAGRPESRHGLVWKTTISKCKDQEKLCLIFHVVTVSHSSLPVAQKCFHKFFTCAQGALKKQVRIKSSRASLSRFARPPKRGLNVSPLEQDVTPATIKSDKQGQSSEIIQWRLSVSFWTGRKKMAALLFQRGHLFKTIASI